MELKFIHIGKCGGTSLNLFLRKFAPDYSKEIHLKKPQFPVPTNEKYIIWIRDPIERFISAFNHSKSIINFDVSTLKGEKPSLENCQAPAKILRKLREGHAFDKNYESLFEYFDNACALAESLSSTNEELKQTAFKLMNHPTEHINKGIGYYTYNGKFLEGSKGSIIKIGSIESYEDDINDLKEILFLPKEAELSHARKNKSTLPRELSRIARKNIAEYYENTDYTAIKMMKQLGLINARLYENYMSIYS